jgi:hypothetical protein
MEREFTKEQQYVLARKRVVKIRKFYKHFTIYVVVNVFLSALFIIGDTNRGDTFMQAVLDGHNYKIWVYWGFGIIFQALNTFGVHLFFSKNWEERKVKQYMETQKYKNDGK